MYGYDGMDPYASDEQAILAMAERKKRERIAARLRDQQAKADQLENQRVGEGTGGGGHGAGPFGNVVTKWRPDYGGMGQRILGALENRSLDPKIEASDADLANSTLRAGPFGGRPPVPVGTGTVLAGPPGPGTPAPFPQASREQGPTPTRGAASGTASGPDFDRLVNAVMAQESRGDPNAVSSAGARGLMQIMPKTGRDPGYGVAPARDNSPAENMRVGREYLGAMLRKYGGDTRKALMAYNAGPGRFDRSQSGGSPLAPETIAYPDAVLGRLGPQAPTGTPGGALAVADTPGTSPGERMSWQDVKLPDASGAVDQPPEQQSSGTVHPASFTDQQKRLYYMSQMGVEGAKEAFAKSILPPDPTAATENEKIDQVRFLVGNGVSQEEAIKRVFGNEPSLGGMGQPIAARDKNGNPVFMQRTPNGMETVPGFTPGMTAAQEIAAQFKQQAVDSKVNTQKAQINSALSQMDNISSGIDRYLAMPGSKEIGTFGGTWKERAGRVAGVATDPSNARSVLKSINAGLLLTTIAQLKALSPTGATGFGPLSNVEGDKLQSAIAVIESTDENLIDPAVVKESLKIVQDWIVRAKAGITSGQWKPDPVVNVGGGSIPKAGDVRGNHRFKGGDLGDKNNWELIQ